MSAYQCSDEHIGQIAALLCASWRGGEEPIVRYDADPEWSATLGKADAYSWVFRQLWTENARSVAFRYGGGPDPCPAIPSVKVDVTVLRYTYARDFTARVCKAVVCLRYQSCEHPGWESSRACGLLRSLERHAIEHMHGWSDAPWGAPFDLSKPAEVTPIF
jgi:hypothetical protein